MILIPDRAKLLQEFIRRLVAYTDKITWFGDNSVARALGVAAAAAAEGGYLTALELLQRLTIMAASEDYLRQLAVERGCPPLTEMSSRVLVVFQPVSVEVMSITAGPPDVIEVSSADPWQAGDQLRIRSADGSVSEAATVASVSTGTGPSGGDEITLTGALVNVYSPSTERVVILFRVVVARGTRISSSVGVTFELLDPVAVGDSNPVLDGESTALGLADKGWAESSVRSNSANVDPLALLAPVPTIRGILSVFNPERAFGGSNAESDYALKYRIIHTPTGWNQETDTWIEATARAADPDVARALRVRSAVVGTMSAKVLSRAGGPLSAPRLARIETYAKTHVRSYMKVEFQNITLTSVEVEARINLLPNYTLTQVWKAGADAIAKSIDYRTWPWGRSVDEADLLSTLNAVEGVAGIETSTFLPASNVIVSSESLPVLVRLSLMDLTTGETINAQLAVSF